ASVGNRRGPTEGADAPPVERQGVSRSGRKLPSSPKRVDDDPRVALPTLGFHYVDCTVVAFESDCFPVESGPGDRKREMDGPRACARVRCQKQEEDDSLGSRFRQNRTILYIESRREADGVTAPPERSQPYPQGAGRSKCTVGHLDRAFESRGQDRKSTRLNSSHVSI